MFIMSKGGFAFITREGGLERNGDILFWLILEVQVLDTFVKVGAKRIFDKKSYYKNILLPQYKTHTLSGTNDIQATDNKQREGRGLL